MPSPDRPHLPGADILQLARGSIDYGFLHGRPLRVDLAGLPLVLTEPAATFTTLRLDEKLRGCCGTLEAIRPLAEDVAHSAFQAAFRDTRFDPVRRDEMGRVRLEVSVLSSPETMTVTSETDLLERLVPGEDGLIIVQGIHRATFLPKVWETLPDPRQFLAQLKLKCGLPTSYWSDQLAFLRYRTTSFAESA